METRKLNTLIIDMAGPVVGSMDNIVAALIAVNNGGDNDSPVNAHAALCDSHGYGRAGHWIRAALAAAKGGWLDTFVERHHAQTCPVGAKNNDNR
jgi:hypothetical protein